MDKQAAIDKIALLEATLERRKRERTFAAFAQRNWPGFDGGWFYDVLFEQLEQFAAALEKRETPRLSLSVPPRHGKSETIIRFAVWLMLRSKVEIIYASYSQEQANRLSRKAKTIAENALSGARLPVNQTREWHLPNGSIFRAVGRGGGITGSGADLVITDDMIKNQAEADSPSIRQALWDWYTTTAQTRLSPGGGELQIGTRWHDEDLIGRSKYPSVTFPAIAEKDEKYRMTGECLHPRFPVDALEEKRSKMLPRHWSCLYQQSPINDASAIVKLHWLLRWHEAMIPQCDMSSDIVTCDASFKGTDTCDFVTISRIRKIGPRYFILDVINERMFFSDTVSRLRGFIEPTDCAILIEDKANGPAIIDVLSREFSNIIAVEPQGSKAARFQAVAPLFQAGNVIFKEGLTEWSEIVNQITRFPAAAHDDIVDSISQGLNWLRNRPDISEGAAVVPFELMLY